jgi:hypothetical protein
VAGKGGEDASMLDEDVRRRWKTARVFCFSQARQMLDHGIGCYNTEDDPSYTLCSKIHAIKLINLHTKTRIDIFLI